MLLKEHHLFEERYFTFLSAVTKKAISWVNLERVLKAFSQRNIQDVFLGELGVEAMEYILNSPSEKVLALERIVNSFDTRHISPEIYPELYLGFTKPFSEENIDLFYQFEACHDVLSKYQYGGPDYHALILKLAKFTQAAPKFDLPEYLKKAFFILEAFDLKNIPPSSIFNFLDCELEIKYQNEMNVLQNIFQSLKESGFSVQKNTWIYYSFLKRDFTLEAIKKYRDLIINNASAILKYDGICRAFFELSHSNITKIFIWMFGNAIKSIKHIEGDYTEILEVETLGRDPLLVKFLAACYLHHHGMDFSKNTDFYDTLFQMDWGSEEQLAPNAIAQLESIVSKIKPNGIQIDIEMNLMRIMAATINPVGYQRIEEFLTCLELSRSKSKLSIYQSLLLPLITGNSKETQLLINELRCDLYDCSRKKLKYPINLSQRPVIKISQRQQESHPISQGFLTLRKGGIDIHRDLGIYTKVSNSNDPLATAQKIIQDKNEMDVTEDAVSSALHPLRFFSENTSPYSSEYASSESSVDSEYEREMNLIRS
jgi:hypothetical protein